jgi:hypothetical protein
MPPKRQCQIPLTDPLIRLPGVLSGKTEPVQHADIDKAKNRKEKAHLGYQLLTRRDIPSRCHTDGQSDTLVLHRQAGINMEVIGYARVVPAEDTTEALAHQRARIEAFCREQNHTLVNFFSETISAEIKLEQRTKLLEAIESCASGQALIVIRLDRLGSNKKVLSKF